MKTSWKSSENFFEEKENFINGNIKASTNEEPNNGRKCYYCPALKLRM